MHGIIIFVFRRKSHSLFHSLKNKNKLSLKYMHYYNFFSLQLNFLFLGKLTQLIKLVFSILQFSWISCGVVVRWNFLRATFDICPVLSGTPGIMGILYFKEWLYQELLPAGSRSTLNGSPVSLLSFILRCNVAVRI